MDVENFPAKIGRNDKVQFKIFKSSRGYGAVHVCLEGGALIPEFVRPEKSEKEQDEKKQERKKSRDKKRRNKKRNQDKTEKPEKENKRRERSSKQKKAKKKFLEIDSTKRFEGLVCAFSLHRFGFIKMLTPEESSEMAKYGILKSGKLCFRVQDIDTEQRPAMVSTQTKVKFSINRVDSGVLYAVDIRGEDEKPIVCTRVPDKKTGPRKLLSDEWIEGTVKFFNWRRGHGRITSEGSDAEFYFHRNDLMSNDKVAGVEAGTKVVCQKVDDPKGPAVTNICNPDKTKLENHLPRYMRSESKKEEKPKEAPEAEAQEAETQE